MSVKLKQRTKRKGNPAALGLDRAPKIARTSIEDSSLPSKLQHRLPSIRYNIQQTNPAFLPLFLIYSFILDLQASGTAGRQTKDIIRIL